MAHFADDGRLPCRRVEPQHALPRPSVGSGAPSCSRALDVGCGLGAFARRLSTLAGQVDGVDRDATVIRRARDLSAHVANVRFVEADFMTWTAPDAYDFISMIAVLHHLAFGDALTKAAHLVRPGGALVVLGLDRAPSLVYAGARGLVAYPLSAYYRVVRRTSPVGAPTLEPAMTLWDIRQQASTLLPGSTIQRHVLWRYSLVWMKS
jgi:SAM-dependent methyltransferase